MQVILNLWFQTVSLQGLPAAATCNGHLTRTQLLFAQTDCLPFFLLKCLTLLLPGACYVLFYYYFFSLKVMGAVIVAFFLKMLGAWVLY